MADVPKRLVGPVYLGNSNAILYTVPSSTLTIVRSIHISNNTTSSSYYTASLAINGVATSYAQCFYAQTPIPPVGALDWSGFLVLNAGDTLQGLASNTSTMTIVICGIEVT